MNAFAFLLTTFSYAQSVPQGMKYQAVARDNKGQVITNQNISLKITLLSQVNKVISDYYSEVHDITTNNLGLFTLVVGEGKQEKGAFSKVPWSTEDIWMQVSIKDKNNTAFTIISNSKLLAVPYAFHAATANSLVGNQSGSNSLNKVELSAANPGIPAQAWSLFGNSNSSSLKDKLGTTDAADLVIVTNNIERLRILANGNIDIKRSVKIGANLVVDSSVYLNRIGGQTFNYGPFTVSKFSPTRLTGPFTVDSLAPSLLTGKLTVDGATDLNSTLNVDGATDLNSRLNVNLQSPTTLTGTLKVNGDAVFNSLTESTSTTTGAVIVGGGVGIGKQLNVGGITNLSNNLNVAGIATVNNATESSSPTTGALVIAGGAGVAGNLNVGGTLSTTGAATINSTLTVNSDGDYAANFVNTTNANGISIQVAAGTPNNDNDFVTFKNSSGNTVGRIEGETLGELYNNADYVLTKEAFIFNVVTGSVNVAIAAFEVAQGIVEVTAASTSFTGCVGFGACVTVPIPSLIISAGTNLILKVATALSEAATLAGAIIIQNKYVANAEAGVGVTYQSGSADYAEWLPKGNNTDRFLPGFIVGLNNGKITLNTAGASKLFAISTKPIILGNMPAGGQEALYEKVAFMGQVPVHVLGKVEIGDYILPSGQNNGLGRAVRPADMKADDYSKIVGVAWSASTSNSYSKINVAIGLNTNDISKVVSEQNTVIQEQGNAISQLKQQMSETQGMLAKLVPGFKQVNGAEVAVTSSTSKLSNFSLPANAIVDEHSNIVYFEVTRNQVLSMFDMAEQIFKENGGDYNTHPFWKKIKTESGYKETVVVQVMAKFKKAIHSHKEVTKNHTD